MAKMYELLRLADFINASSEGSPSFVLVTIHKTEGSSYRKKGSQMLIREDMEYAGALSGGCVEKEVLRLASKVFYSKSSLASSYDGSKTLGCKGILYFFIEYLPNAAAKSLSEHLSVAAKNRISLELSILLNSKDQIKASFLDLEDQSYFHSYKALNPEYKSEILCHIDAQHQLIIYGSNHDVVPLASLAQSLGILVHIVLDHAFPTEKGLKAFDCSSLPMHQFLKQTKIDRHTSIVLMTHSFKKDKDALKLLLDTPASYISMLGPKSRKDQIFAALENEINMEKKNKIKSVKSPAGIYIHAQTPEEIALSILAEIVSEQNKKVTI